MSETWDLSLSLIFELVLRTFPGLLDWDNQLVSAGIFSSFFEGISYEAVVQIGAQVNSNGIWGKLLVVSRLFLGVTRHVFLMNASHCVGCFFYRSRLQLSSFGNAKFLNLLCHLSPLFLSSEIQRTSSILLYFRTLFLEHLS